MTLFYPRVALDSDLLDGFRLLFGSAMVLSLVLGMAAILRRDIAGHRAWMIRGYAIGQGAGTQVLVHLPWFLKGGFRTLSGTPVFAYLRQLRMEEARRLLRKRHLDVSEVAQRVGYANPSKFAAAFRREFGMSPSAL